MKRISRMMIMSLFILCIIQITVYAADYFDIESIDKGVIGISCQSTQKLKVIIKYGEGKYTYDLNNKGNKEFYPLQMGNGEYKVLLYENTTGSSYKLLASKKVEINIKDTNSVFLPSIQNINWASNPETVKKAVELTKDTKSLTDKANILWKYVVNNYSYDNDKLSKVESGYIPVPDNTLKELTGICYDFSSLYASMLRSEGIPAKLVKGYAPDYAVGYHAWNEVYDESTNKWVVIDATYDLQALQKSIKFNKVKDSKAYTKVYEY